MFSFKISIMTNVSIDLDDLDWRLIEHLQTDASQSNQALAEAAGVSPATTLRRVRRLREAGVIQATTVLLAPEIDGQGLEAMCEVTLDRQGAEWLEAFEQRVIGDDAVQACWRVSPGPDFVLWLWAPDMPAFHLLSQRLFTQEANVRNVKTYFSIHRGKLRPKRVRLGD